MANEVNANINIGVDSTQALASLRLLQNQISSFNKSVIASNAASVAAQKSAMSGLAAQIGATKAFSTSMVSVETSVSSLGKAIDGGRLSLGQYFKYGIASSRTFGSVFKKEHIEMTAVASSRVKALQTQYLALGATQNGVNKAMAVRPLHLFNADAAIAAQRAQLFNRVLRDGSTSLINFGKNTQWAGRQLMVGFTVPLTIFGGIAGKMFMDLEKQIVNFRRVYGDATTPLEETNGMIQQIKDLGTEFTKYGIAVKNTIELAADAAAAGAEGEDLLAQTTAATRLATLGMIDQQEALTTTIAMQAAFKMSAEELGQSVNFLNAVENQTVLSLEDISIAVPKVATVIKGLGGDVADMSIFLTAMREGGVNAAQGANALKSGLASLINPTKAARDQLKEVGINIDYILETTKGDIRGTVMKFGDALGELDNFSRQQTLAKVFGKFQFARLGALFENISVEGSQAQRVIDLTGESIEGLGALADKELGAIEESVGVKFTGALERLKVAIAPIGEMFLKIATPILELAIKIADKFNDISPTVRKFLTVLVAGVGIVAPAVIMLIGLFGNFIGQAIKGFAAFNSLFNRLKSGGGDLKYLTSAELDAAAAAASLEGKTTSLTGSLNIQRDAVDQLSRAYARYVSSARVAATSLPQGMMGPMGESPRRMATGGVVAGTGNKDTVPALLTPGESVITKDATKKFGPLLQAINDGSIPGFAKGTVNLGGQNMEMDFSRTKGDSSSIAAIERMFDNIAKDASLSATAAEETRVAFRKILTDIKAQQDVGAAGPLSAKGVGKGLSQSGNPNLQRLAQEKIYSSPEFIRIQTTGMTWESQSAEIQAVQARVKDRWSKYGGVTEKQLNNLTSVQASHIQKETDALGDKVWTPENLTPDLGAVNNYLNRVETMTLQTAKGSEHMNSLVAQTGMEYEDVLREVKLLEKGIHPTTKESQDVLLALGMLDEELSLAAAEAKRLKTSLGTNSSTGYLASGAVGALTSRTPGGEAQRSSNKYQADAAKTGNLIGASAVQGTSVGAGTRSNSRKTVQIGQWIAGGLEQGIEQGTPGAVAAAQNLRNEVDGQIDMFNQPTGPVQGELPFPPPAIENRRVSAESLMPRTGGPRREDRGRMHSVEQAYTAAMEQNTKEISRSSGVIKETTKRQFKVGAIAKKFGKTMSSGGIKVNGAMGAMSGLAFGASMLGGNLGEMAQKVLPAIFAFQGLVAILPLLTNPVVLLIAALAGVAVGFWMLDNNRKKIQKKIIETSIAMNGSAKAFDELSKEIGDMKPSEKFASVVSGLDSEKEKQALTEGQTFLESDSGKSMVERAKLLSGEDRKDAIERELIQSIAFDIITPEQAEGVARAMALALKDPVIGTSLVSGITSYMTGSSSEIAKGIEGLTDSVVTDIVGTITAADDLAYLQQELEQLQFKEGRQNAGDGAPVFTEEDKARMEEIQKQFLKSGDAVTASIGPIIDSSRKLAEAQAYLNLQYRKGSLDAEGYADSAGRIQFAQLALAQTFQELQAATTDSDFSENLKMSVLATGMAEEDFAEMESQARALEKVLTETFGRDPEWAKKASNSLQFALSSGFLDSATAGSIPKLLEDKQYTNIVNLALEGDDPTLLANVVKSLNQIEMLPDPIKTQIVSEFLSSDFTDPAEFNAWIEKALVMSSYFAKHPRLQLEAYVALNEDSMTTEEMLDVENFVNSIDRNSDVSAIVSINKAGLESIVEANAQWDELGKKKEISKVITMNDEFSLVAQKFKDDLAALDALPNVFKKAILLEMNIVSNAEIDLAAAQNKLDSVVPGDLPSRAGYTIGADKATASIAKAMENIKKLLGEGTPEKTDPIPKDTGGGSPSLTWLQQLIADTKSNLALFPKMLSKIRGKGIPEQIIEMIGGGEEGEKRAKELLDLSKKKTKKLIEDYEKTLVNTAVKNTRTKRDEKRDTFQATNILVGEGFSSEEAQSIASSKEDVDALLAAVKAGPDEVLKLTKAWRGLEKVPEYIDPIEKALKDLEDDYKLSMLPIDKKIDEQEKILEGIQKEIDAIQELNDQDQDRIRTLERRKEMIEREIQDLERLNELDERRTETLQRQDELRNRDADALSHELEVLSDMETKIKDSYQQRVDALKDVSELNSQIAQQQKDQLGLSQALAQGDIYAATAAAQTMRQNQAKDAEAQVSKGLEQARDNSIDNLRTSNGLTRVQAEERIDQIKEQSYQSSLLIRDIEDQIYARNQSLIPLKDQQLAIDLQIRDIADLIYDRETEIIKIENERLDPIQKTLDGYLAQAKSLKLVLDLEKTALEGAQLMATMTEMQSEGVGNLANEYLNLGNAIAAVNAIASSKKGTFERPVKSEYQKEDGSINKSAYNKAKAEYNSNVDRVQSQSDADIENILIGARSMGMGGKVKGYANGGMMKKYGAGGVKGDGSRDSVSAMLTPGEFVIRKSMVEKYGMPMLKSMNQGALQMPKYNMGGSGQNVKVGSGSSNANISAPMYNNYSVNVSATTNANPDEIATAAVMKIKQMQNMQIRSGRGY